MTTSRDTVTASVVLAALLLGGCAKIYTPETQGMLTDETLGETTSVEDTSGSSTTDDTDTDPSAVSDTAGGSSSSSTTANETATDDTTTAEPDTTTAMDPECGNGIVEDGEECDDANGDPDDGCWLCARDRIVFVTSEVYQGHTLEGLIGADARCRMLAALAGLENVPSYRAWLSTANVSAAKRMHHSHGRYTLVNGLTVAYGWHGLVSGTLLTPINVDENSQVHAHPSVWTGTLADGTPALGSDFCNDWDNPIGFMLTGGTGLTTESDGLWSFFFQYGCGGDSSLYCIEN